MGTSNDADQPPESDDSGDLSMHATPGNARYSIRKITGRIVSGLKGKELRSLGHQGFILPEDKIQKQGHKTWHNARDVLGLLLHKECEDKETSVTITADSTKEVRKSKELEQAIFDGEPYKDVQMKPNDKLVFKTVKRICLAHIDEQRGIKISAILRNRTLLATAYDQLTNKNFRNAWFQMNMDSQIILLNSIRIANAPRVMSKTRRKEERKLARTPELMKTDFDLFRRIAHAKDGLKTLNPNFKTEYGRQWTLYTEPF